MPYNGSGVFSIVNTFVPGTTIFSSAVNDNFTDIATGLSTCVLKDGTQTITANIPMAGFGFTGVGSIGSQAVITVASATTCDILSQSSLLIAISGVVTITGFGADAASRRNQIKFVRATGAFTLTHNATSLILPGAANIVVASGDTFIVISDASSNARVYAYQRGAVSPASQIVLSGYLYGLAIANNSGDATNDIDFGVGACADSTAVAYLTLAGGLTKRLDAAWAVGTNQGGRMSAAAIANTTYHCFLICRPDTGVVDCGFDVSPTAPTLPTNYTLFRRIGSIVRLGATINPFVQIQDTFYDNNGLTFAENATNPGTSAVTVTLTVVPTGILVQALMLAELSDATPAVATHMLITSLNTSDIAPGAGGTSLAIGAAGAGVPQRTAGDFTKWTNTSAQVRYRLDNSNADIIARISQIGWIDTRGRLG